MSDRKVSDKDVATHGKPKDIVDFIVADHEDVRKQYKEIQDAGSDKSTSKKHDDVQTTFEGMLWNIAKHSVAEELVLYAVYPEVFGQQDGEKVRQEAIEEHETVKKALEQLDGKQIKDQETRRITDEMIKNLFEHMEKEEKGDLIKVRAKLSSEQLMKMGVEFEKTKKLIPEEETPGKKPAEAPFKSAMKLAAAKMEDVKSALGKFFGADEKQEGEHYNLRHRDNAGHVAQDDHKDAEKNQDSKNGHGDKASPKKSGSDKVQHAGDHSNGDKNSTHHQDSDNKNGASKDGGDNGNHGKRHQEAADNGSHINKKIALSGEDHKNGDAVAK